MQVPPLSSASRAYIRRHLNISRRRMHFIGRTDPIRVVRLSPQFYAPILPTSRSFGLRQHTIKTPMQLCSTSVLLFPREGNEQLFCFTRHHRINHSVLCCGLSGHFSPSCT